MTRKEVDTKFDDIVEFADIGDFIDAPVKTYSSGMFVRLGFAVAVHSEPDILLADEVLAVGDAAFRTKCYKKMNEIKAKRNVSIIFVSHDLYSVGVFCEKGLFIYGGRDLSQGKIQNVISDYQVLNNRLIMSQTVKKTQNDLIYCTKDIEITSVKCLNRDGIERKAFSSGDTLRLKIQFKAKKEVPDSRFEIYIRKSGGELISVFGPHFDKKVIPSIKPGNWVIECVIDSLSLLSNSYYIDIGIYDETRKILLDWWNIDRHPDLTFEILPNQVSIMMGQYTPICHFKSKWSVNQES